MLNISRKKWEALNRLSDKNGVINALAIDQRGSLQKMINDHSTKKTDVSDIVNFKKLISEELTPFSSSILLDPEYGLPASAVRHPDAGLILAYEKTGYDASEPGRLPDLLEEWSVGRLKEAGADAVKFLLYYDVDESPKINNYKYVFMERVGAECAAEDIPFFLEIVTYDAHIEDVKGAEYAKVRPRKVIEAMKEFSKPEYRADVLKVETPVNMNFVEGYAGVGEVVHGKDEAANYFKEQSSATHLPFIFLSGGVSAALFQDTLTFAHEAGSAFNGVLCGRATWKDSVLPFATDGENAAREWMQHTGSSNIKKLNSVIERTASSWFSKVNH